MLSILLNAVIDREVSFMSEGGLIRGIISLLVTELPDIPLSLSLNLLKTAEQAKAFSETNNFATTKYRQKNSVYETMRV